MFNMSPKQIIMNFAKNNANPVVKNLIDMAEKKDTKGLEKFARNLCKEKGIDFDKEISQFARNFK